LGGSYFITTSFEDGALVGGITVIGNFSSSGCPELTATVLASNNGVFSVLFFGEPT
jgi:hypothetical protein